MPELPEVETVRAGLAAHVVGSRIKAVTVTGRRTIRRQSIAEFAADLSDRRVEGARRRGKYLLVDLDDHAVLVVHLRMSGQLLLLGTEEPLALHTHVRLDLGGGRELRFVDPRTFGELFVSDDLDERRVPRELSSLGIDPVVDGLDPKALSAMLRGRATPLKAFLLDQSKVCGIGNLYADEICFAARLLPLRRCSTLRRGEVARLAASVSSVLDAAVLAGGSSLRDARYRDLSGGLGRFQVSHAVYDRAGKPCVACGSPIERTKVTGRSTHFCRHCQA